MKHTAHKLAVVLFSVSLVAAFLFLGRDRPAQAAYYDETHVGTLNLEAKDATIETTLTSSGNTTIGDAATDTCTINAGPVSLPNATSAADALILGSDVALYRSSANTLTIPDNISTTGTVTATGGFSGPVSATTVTASTSFSVGSGTSFTKILANTVSFGSSETTKTLTLSGVASGDLPLGSIVSGNTSGVGIKTLAVSTNAVLVTLTGTPGATTVVFVLVARKP